MIYLYRWYVPNGRFMFQRAVCRETSTSPLTLQLLSSFENLFSPFFFFFFERISRRQRKLPDPAVLNSYLLKREYIFPKLILLPLKFHAWNFQLQLNNFWFEKYLKSISRKHSKWQNWKICFSLLENVLYTNREYFNIELKRSFLSK